LRYHIYTRHCEHSEAISLGLQDCFAALAMTVCGDFSSSVTALKRKRRLGNCDLAALGKTPTFVGAAHAGGGFAVELLQHGV
jgi:hypothetical protein